jgi:hypothetical protein
VGKCGEKNAKSRYNWQGNRGSRAICIIAAKMTTTTQLKHAYNISAFVSVGLHLIMFLIMMLYIYYIYLSTAPEHHSTRAPEHNTANIQKPLCLSRASPDGIDRTSKRIHIYIYIYTENKTRTTREKRTRNSNFTELEKYALASLKHLLLCSERSLSERPDNALRPLLHTHA